MSLGDIAHQAHHMIGAARMAGSAVKGAAGLFTGHRGADGKMHGGLIPGLQGGIRALSRHSQDTAAKKAGGAKAKEAAMGQFDKAAQSGGGGYQSAKDGVGGGKSFSGAELEAMKSGTADTAKFGSAENQKAKYNALREEAGDRAAKGFEHQASKQWWANAAYKAMTGGDEKIDEKSKTNGGRFTGVGSKMVDNQGCDETSHGANVKSYAEEAGEQYGKNALSFFQPPKDSQLGIANVASGNGMAGNKGVSPENKIV